MAIYLLYEMQVPENGKYPRCQQGGYFLEPTTDRVVTCSAAIEMFFFHFSQRFLYGIRLYAPIQPLNTVISHHVCNLMNPYFIRSHMRLYLE